MISIRWERKIHPKTKDKILSVVNAYLTLDPPVAERLQKKLGGNYLVYQGDNHIALHALTWWAKFDKHNQPRRQVGKKYVGDRFAVLTDGIIV